MKLEFISLQKSTFAPVNGQIPIASCKLCHDNATDDDDNDDDDEKNYMNPE